jgi:hypothetical protein
LVRLATAGRAATASTPSSSEAAVEKQPPPAKKSNTRMPASRESFDSCVGSCAARFQQLVRRGAGWPYSNSVDLAPSNHSKTHAPYPYHTLSFSITPRANTPGPSFTHKLAAAHAQASGTWGNWTMAASWRNWRKHTCDRTARTRECRRSPCTQHMEAAGGQFPTKGRGRQPKLIRWR